MDFTREMRRQKTRKKRHRNNILFVCMTILLILLSATAIYLLYLYNQEKNRAIEAMNQKTALEQDMESGQYITVKEAEAKGIELIKAAKADQAVLTLKSFETLAAVANGNATKIIIPSELQNLATISTSIGEMFKEVK